MSRKKTAIIDATIAAALKAGNATVEGSDLLPERLAKRVKLETVEGRRVATILNEAGEPMLDATGKPAKFSDLVNQAKQKWPGLFAGSGGGGGGSPPRQGKSAPRQIDRGEWDKLTPYEQAAKAKQGVRPVD